MLSGDSNVPKDFSGMVKVDHAIAEKIAEEQNVQLKYYLYHNFAKHTAIVAQDALTGVCAIIDLNTGVSDTRKHKTYYSSSKEVNEKGWIVRIEEAEWNPQGNQVFYSPYKLPFKGLLCYLLITSWNEPSYDRLWNNCSNWAKRVVVGLNGQTDKFTEGEVVAVAAFGGLAILGKWLKFL